MRAVVSMLALYTVALAALTWLVAGLRAMVGRDDVDERRAALVDVVFAALVSAFVGWGVWGWAKHIAAALAVQS